MYVGVGNKYTNHNGSATNGNHKAYAAFPMEKKIT